MKLIVGKFDSADFISELNCICQIVVAFLGFSVQVAEPAKTRFSMYYFYELI